MMNDIFPVITLKGTYFSRFLTHYMLQVIERLFVSMENQQWEENAVKALKLLLLWCCAIKMLQI